MKLIYQIIILVLIPLVIFTGVRVYNYAVFIDELSDLREEEFKPLIESFRVSSEVLFLTAKIEEKRSLILASLDANNRVNALNAFSESQDLTDQRMHAFTELNELSDLYGVPEREYLTDLSELIASRDADHETLQQLILSSQPQSSIQDVMASLREKDAQTIALLEELNSDLTFQFNDVISKRNKAEMDGLNNLYWTAGLIFAYFLIAILYFVFTLIRPIEDLTKAINRLSLGELDVEVKGKKRKDELGGLARAFDRVLVSLKIAMRKKPPKIKPFKPWE